MTPQRHAPATLVQGNKPVTHRIVGSVGFRAVWNVYREKQNTSPRQVSICGRPSRSLVFTPITLNAAQKATARVLSY